MGLNEKEQEELKSLIGDLNIIKKQRTLHLLKKWNKEVTDIKFSGVE